MPVSGKFVGRLEPPHKKTVSVPMARSGDWGISPVEQIPNVFIGEVDVSTDTSTTVPAVADSVPISLTP